MNVLRHLKLWHKFSALGVLAVAMAAVPLYQVIQRETADLAVARAEDDGLDAIRLLTNLQRNLQVHRSLAGMTLAGNSSVDAERKARQADVTARLTELQKLATERGYDQVAVEAKAMKAAWDALVAKVDGRTAVAKESFEAHTELVERSIHALDLSADASGLSLDPVAETYFVMTALVDHVPRMSEALDALATIGTTELAAKQMSFEGRLAMATLSHQVHGLQGRIEGQVGKAAAIEKLVADTLSAAVKSAVQLSDDTHEAAE